MNVGSDEARKYGYEFGIRRTNFEHDGYHKLLCKENRASCYGRSYRSKWFLITDRWFLITDGWFLITNT